VGRAADEPKSLKPIFPAAKEIPFVVPKDGIKDSPFEIKTANELAKSALFGEGGAEKLKKVVNFDKEKLVVFSWAGNYPYAGVTATLADDGKAATFTWHQGNAKKLDERKNCMIFVVPKDAATKIEIDPRVPK
jgi:hypothetical protein